MPIPVCILPHLGEQLVRLRRVGGLKIHREHFVDLDEQVALVLRAGADLLPAPQQRGHEGERGGHGEGQQHERGQPLWVARAGQLVQNLRRKVDRHVRRECGKDAVQRGRSQQFRRIPVPDLIGAERGAQRFPEACGGFILLLFHRNRPPPGSSGSGFQTVRRSGRPARAAIRACPPP